MGSMARKTTKRLGTVMVEGRGEGRARWVEPGADAHAGAMGLVEADRGSDGVAG